MSELFNAETKKQITLVAQVQAKSGKEVELEKELFSLINPTRAEEGCLLYELYETEVSGSYYFYEIWEDAASLKAHGETERFAAFLKATENLVEGNLEVSKWERNDTEIPEIESAGDAIALLAFFNAAKSKEALLDTELQKLIEPTRAEKGCLSYDFHHAQDSTDQFLFSELWASASDLDNHSKSDHFKAFASTMEQLVEGELKLVKATRIA